MERSGLTLIRNFVSKLFQPQNIIPKYSEVKHDDLTSRSQKLMLDVGIIRQASNGAFCLLPLGERSLRKLVSIVDEEMRKIDAQKVILPSLTPARLWKKTGRWDSAAAELFSLKDRHEKEFVLSPTHEESVTDLLASVNNSYRQFPLRLYQITSKFRDEMKPRFGLLRAKEFIMKDLYSFDVDLKKARETYEDVTSAYKNIFDRIGVRYIRVAGSAGMMGGSLSHEFHFPASVGEDYLVICENCGHGDNKDILMVGDETKSESIHPTRCSSCDSSAVKVMQGIEVGHTFLLGTKYTDALNAQFLQHDGKPSSLQMGSYGLGMTRILAAAVEVMSQPTDIRWPLALAPFKLCIIPPKAGSKEAAASGLVDSLCHELMNIPSMLDDIIVDDRLSLTVGKRLRDANHVGYPFIVVIGKKSLQTEPLLELHDLLSGQQFDFTLPSLVQYFVNCLQERRKV